MAHIKDLTEESLIKGLFTKLMKDGGAPKDKRQWEEKPLPFLGLRREQCQLDS